MRLDVAFPCRGEQIAGWLFVPDGGGRHPAIVMAHGFSCVKEQGLEPIAERFRRAGFAVLAFDYRGFGASTGQPRGRLLPLEQVADYAAALDWLGSRPEIDPDRLAVWGTSFSGGLVLRLAATDRRARAVVAQVPSVVNAENSIFMDPGPEGILSWLIGETTRDRDAFGPDGTIPVAARAGAVGVLGGDEGWAAYTAPDWAVPTWRNAITVDSLAAIRDFDSTALIDRIAPTPLLLIAAEEDALIPPTLVRAAHDRARAPKSLETLPCRHFDIYREPWRDRAADLAIRWFERYL
jgi:uncharacterized protein